MTIARKAKTPLGGAGLSLGKRGMGVARFPNRSADFGKGSNEKKCAGLLTRAISVEGIGHENADTEYGQQRCHDIDHRRIPRVTTMPKTAVSVRWR
jgi:hypothetical protein